MLSSINARPSSFTHDHHKAVRVNQIGSVPPGCYSGVGCPHHNIFSAERGTTTSKITGGHEDEIVNRRVSDIVAATRTMREHDPVPRRLGEAVSHEANSGPHFSVRCKPHTGTASPLQDHGLAGG